MEREKLAPLLLPVMLLPPPISTYRGFFFLLNIHFIKSWKFQSQRLNKVRKHFSQSLPKKLRPNMGFLPIRKLSFFGRCAFCVCSLATVLHTHNMQPNERLFSIPTAWRDPLPDICTVSTPIPPDTSLYDGIGEDLQRKPRCIHLFVTAEIMIRTSWILFDPEFTDHFPRPMYFSRREFGERTSNHQLAFTTEIKTHYSFNADRSTICFWKVSTLCLPVSCIAFS